MAAEWAILQAHDINDDHVFTEPMIINKNEFITTVHNGQDTMSIHKYNINTNEWNILAVYSTEAGFEHKAGYDSQNKLLYICGVGKTKKEIHIYDIITKEKEMHSTMKQIGFTTSVCLNGDELHLTDSTGHYSWNTITHKMNDKVHEMAECAGLNYGALIYLQSENALLYLGGFNGVKNSDTDKIYQYSIDEKQWQVMDITLPTPLSSFCCELSVDQQYLFIFGGKTYDGTDFNYDHKQDILILNTITYEIRMSTVKLPDTIINTIYATSMIHWEETKLSVNGYSRDNCEDLMIPKEILMIIEQYVSLEYIYLMETYCNEFWRMRVDTILQ